MYRRLYFSFPTPAQTRAAVADLQGAGVPFDHMHALAREGTDLTGLPQATQRQRHDQVWRLEGLLWYGNLAVFALALAGLGAALMVWSPTAMVACLAVMVATFVAGERFAVRLPHAHLEELRIPMGNGEVALLVDVPFRRVRALEHLIEQRHPEAGIAGVGWTIEAFGV
jgi:hypothetical protein